MITKKKETTGEQSTGNRLYPNPTTGVVTMELSSPLKADAQLMIYDVAGKQVLSFAIAVGESVYAPVISSLSPGLYICKLWEASEAVWTEKLVVLKK